MKKTIVFLSLIVLGTITYAQFTPEVKKTDSIIAVEIINPGVNKARQANETPDWVLFNTSIVTKYDAIYADRTITKAKIYYYYGKDWPLFSTALVHYTDAYENKNDLKLMNKNAKMILQHSDNKEDLKSAIKWMIIAIDKEQGNSEYKETYNLLIIKLK